MKAKATRWMNFIRSLAARTRCVPADEAARGHAELAPILGEMGVGSLGRPLSRGLEDILGFRFWAFERRRSTPNPDRSRKKDASLYAFCLISRGTKHWVA